MSDYDYGLNTIEYEDFKAALSYYERHEREILQSLNGQGENQLLNRAFYNAYHLWRRDSLPGTAHQVIRTFRALVVQS